MISRLFLLVSFALTLVSCDSGLFPIGILDDSPGTSAPSHRVTIPFGGSVDGHYAGDSLSFIDISDSRCPIGAVCVWEGAAVVTLRVRHHDGSTNEFTLSTAAAAGPRQTVINGATVALSDVTPYPQLGGTIPKQNYSAIIDIHPPAGIK